MTTDHATIQLTSQNFREKAIRAWRRAEDIRINEQTRKHEEKTALTKKKFVEYFGFEPDENDKVNGNAIYLACLPGFVIICDATEYSEAYWEIRKVCPDCGNIIHYPSRNCVCLEDFGSAIVELEDIKHGNECPENFEKNHRQTITLTDSETALIRALRDMISSNE